MSATVKNIGPTIVPDPLSSGKLIEGATDPATPLNPSTLQDALLVQENLKRKREAGSEDGPQGEVTETELGSQTKRTRLTSNSLPSPVKTTTAPATSYSLTPIDLNLMEPQAQPAQANPNISFLDASQGPASTKNSRRSSRHTTPVLSLKPSKNQTSLSAPNSQPPSQPSRVGSPTGWLPILHFPVPLPPSQPPSRPTSPRHRYFEPSSIGPGFAGVYPQPVNPPTRNLSISTPTYLEHEYRTNRPPPQHLELVRMEQRPYIQTGGIAYPHPSVFQHIIRNMPRFSNFVSQSGVSVPFVQGPAPGRVVASPHLDTVEPRHDFNGHQSVHVPDFVQHQMTPQQAFLSQPPQYQFQARHNDYPEKGQSLPPKPPRKGTQSTTIERSADILMDLINAKVEVGVKNSRLIKEMPGALLASLERPTDGKDSEGSTKERCEKAVGTDEDQAREMDADKLLGLRVEEKSNPVHKTFVAQAGAWAEERCLLIKRQEELEEEKRVAEERQVADSEQVSKERKEYKSKIECLSSRVKKLQRDMRTIIRERNSRRATSPRKVRLFFGRRSRERYTSLELGNAKETACDNEFGSNGYTGRKFVGILGENQGPGESGEIGAL